MGNIRQSGFFMRQVMSYILRYKDIPLSSSILRRRITSLCSASHFVPQYACTSTSVSNSDIVSFAKCHGVQYPSGISVAIGSVGPFHLTP